MVAQVLNMYETNMYVIYKSKVLTWWYGYMLYRRL